MRYSRIFLGAALLLHLGVVIVVVVGMYYR